MARYRIVPESSRVFIDARSNLHPIHSESDGLEGFIELALGRGGDVDLAVKPEGKLSFAVERLSSGNRIEDHELYRRIDATRYRTIEGVIDTVESSGEDGRYKVSGEVTFRGVVQRHEDEMTIAGAGADALDLAGQSSFDIREFGMDPPRVLMLRVKPDVEVRVEIHAVKEA